MRIAYLADHQHHIPQLAAWHHEQWGHLSPDSSLEKRMASLRKSNSYSQIPTTFIAFENEMLLGSASLVKHDLATRPEMTPWLASVYVSREYRNRGVGSAIVQRVMDEARILQVERLYLITPNKQSFYSRLGWRAEEEVEYRGEQVTIMQWYC